MYSVRLLSSTASKAAKIPTTALKAFSTTTSRAGDKYVMNDPVEHATGLEKYELLAKQAGNDDPFFMKAQNRGAGTKDNPNIVNAMDSFRAIGCVCDSNDTHVKWMWVFEGKPTRCMCGHWFELKRHDAPEKFKMPL